MSASGKYAYGICDRTGFRYPLKDLVPQYKNQRPTGLMVGRDMVDIDHEQLRIGDLKLGDEQSLKNPRPETGQAEARALYAFNPVGGGVTEAGSRTVGLDMLLAMGRVSVS